MGWGVRPLTESCEPSSMPISVWETLEFESYVLIIGVVIVRCGPGPGPGSGLASRWQSTSCFSRQSHRTPQ